MSSQRTVHLVKPFAAALVTAFGLALAPAAAGSGAYIYWWQQNMPANVAIADRTGAHNHIYNELYFGPNAGWRSQVWEVTPAGYRHFVRWCTGNCFFSHPGWFYTYSYCANRDIYGNPHFVNRCMDRW
jgi:hypothetical protein